MAITLYDATIPTYLQYLAGGRRILQKGLEHAQAQGLDPDSLVEARLIDDMFPFSFQVRQLYACSANALRDASQGRFQPPGEAPKQSYADLQQVVADAEAAVRAWTPEAVNALEGREVVLGTVGFEQTFTAENYLLSFAMPNFFFHLVTTYDILRAKGVPIGKAQYLGRMRFK